MSAAPRRVRPQAARGRVATTVRSTLLAAGLMLTGVAAQAAFVESRATFAANATPFSIDFAVPLFDSRLGTLNNILLSLTTSIVGEIGIYNPGPVAKPFVNAFATIPVTVTSKAPDASALTAHATATVAAGQAAPGISTFSGIASSGSSSTSVLPADFASYIGPGSGSALFSAVSGAGTFGGTTGSNLFFGGAATANGVFTVRYDYDPVAPVPLPAAAWLLGSGLVWFGAMRRRRA